MGASRRFRRNRSREQLNPLRKSYRRQLHHELAQQAEIRRAATSWSLPENELPPVQDAFTAGFVLTWFASFATPEVLACTA